MRLERSLQAWDTASFADTLGCELEQQRDELPLQQGLAASSAVLDEPLTVLLLNREQTPQALHIKLGVFYRGVVSGCSCANDPTPDSEHTEYCELLLEIDRRSAAATVSLLAD